jgi:2',3'-cyclic-nucleotide 2'-phosphodiesterase/3'-nucleotidase
MPLDRRLFLGRTAATGAVAAPAGAREDGRGRGRAPKRYSFSVLGTTDPHGNVFDRDYFTDAESDDRRSRGCWGTSTRRWSPTSTR